MSAVALTDEERTALIGQMIIAAPWLSEAQANVLLDGTQEERVLIIQSRATASITEGPEIWQKMLTVLNAVAGVAGAISGITSAISGVYALKTL
jgi:hypothetical protein